jgi:hypothetical protein
MWKIRLHPRVDINEVDGTGTGTREYAKVVANWKEWIKRLQRISAWIVATGNVGFQTESRLEPHVGKPIAGIGSKCPGPDVRGTENAELPQPLKIEVPAAPLSCDRPPESCAQSVSQFVCYSSLVGRIPPIQAQIVGIYRDSSCQRARRVDTPETNLMVWDIVEETWFVFIGPHGKNRRFASDTLFAAVAIRM